LSEFLSLQRTLKLSTARNDGTPGPVGFFDNAQPFRQPVGQEYADGSGAWLEGGHWFFSFKFLKRVLFLFSRASIRSLDSPVSMAVDVATVRKIAFRETALPGRGREGCFDMLEQIVL
jgi:hypothetical protein